ncbi:MAG: polysaccharide biosynthesis/export family protein, partial [Bacteroidia bacterium]|nr:polysaccharide biosynthesis/export family protein [Bacteroidia bacterium]
MKKSLIVAFGLLALLASSCTNYKKILYLQDLELEVPYDVAPRPEIRITENDRIKIVVTCSEPALAAPFNLSTGTFFIDPMTGEMTSSPVSLNETGYLVDKNGCINFPVFGYLYVDGMTLREIEEYITQKIIESKYIKEPIVLADFLNFQYTVLGEGSAANYTVNGNSINILQAIANMGDIPTTAKRN